MDLTETQQDVRVTVHGEPWTDARVVDIVNQLERSGVHRLDTRTKHNILFYVLESQFPHSSTVNDFQYLCSDVIERITGRPAVIEHNQSAMWDLLLQLCDRLKKNLPIRTHGRRPERLALVHNSHIVVASVPICRTDDDDYDPKDSLDFNEEQE